MTDLLLAGATVIDATGSRRADVAVRDGVVVDVGEGLDAAMGTLRLDVTDCIVSPGLVDLDASLGEPGHESAETVACATRSAALGGYTVVVARPDTDPALDCAAVVRELHALSAGASTEVACAATLTKGRRGEELTPMAELAALGVRIFVDDGRSIADAGLLRRALEYARDLGVIVGDHCVDAGLAGGGVFHEGEWSSRLGLPGVPSEAEELVVMRDIALARMTGAPIHLQHLSTAASVAMVRAAKAGGVPVSAAVTPQHLALSELDALTFDPMLRFDPPLRSTTDLDALRIGVGDTTIDAVVSDHTPHPQEDKELPFDQAPPGSIGLETALAVVLTEADLDHSATLGAMSWRPAELAGLADRHGGPVAPGRPANLCVIDPATEWTAHGDDTASVSANCAFEGRAMRGRVRHTVLGGEPVVLDGIPQR